MIFTVNNKFTTYASCMLIVEICHSCKSVSYTCLTGGGGGNHNRLLQQRFSLYMPMPCFLNLDIKI